MPNRNPPRLKDRPLIIGHLSGLDGDASTLADKIHERISEYQEQEALRALLRAQHGSAIDQFALLSEMEEALEVTKRKMKSPPAALKAWYWSASSRNSRWDETVENHDRVLAPVLAAITEAKKVMEEEREKQGRPGGGNLDDLVANIRALLIEAGGKNNWNARMAKILAAYGFEGLTSRDARLDAAARGASRLEGPAPEGSITWFNERLPR